MSATLFLLFLFTSFITPATPLSFNFSSFNSSTPQFIQFQNDTFFDKVIKLTKNELGTSLGSSVGRAIYRDPLILWDNATGEVADFTTHFSFSINALNQTYFGDGLAFFLVPYPSIVPPFSAGGNLGLVNDSSAPNATSDKGSNFVAVEFDTFPNYWDPSVDHVGIDVNSVLSAATVTWNSSLKDGRTGNAWVSYNASMKNLSVFVTYEANPRFAGDSTLSHIIDLREFLPEKVAIGFSASTGSNVEIHSILSWEFSSTPLSKEDHGNNKKGKVGIGVTIGIGFFFLLVGLTWFMLWRRRSRKGEKTEEALIEDDDGAIDDEFEMGTGPKRFSYNDLAAATNNFAEELKLGEGGFGGVYKGVLDESKIEVAIKRVSKGSKQGKKEFIAEVKIITRLRHRNLVQLVGWFHGRGELMLVYEYLPNGSLDNFLYGSSNSLSWPLRYKAALGIASALLYLHEEWEECVVHRDVKPSNVMLHAGFNAKLGDFGLARLVDHNRGMQTTVLAGTMGYLAPECVISGKASKESDVYAFGVVALEIACGRRPVETKEQADRVLLLGWVWELYGGGRMLEAVDSRLESEFKEEEITRLMAVGLWCAHPDSGLRPTMRQAMSVLNFESPPPTLPTRMPVPMYCSPPLPLQMHGDSYTTTSSSFQNWTSSSSTTTATNTTSSGSTNCGLDVGPETSFRTSFEVQGKTPQNMFIS
ncbi:hypothetical protein HPP92_012059 [Vanilla planifolia]|uniref:non-specific serine/threonine protein kinase n=1 Tax=Vanilla planifolia TaxID=51239 RepID=A0A835R9P0_VANPL|nr:hypothetical protein HPP92_012059 [Vanilla planifolia]